MKAPDKLTSNIHLPPHSELERRSALASLVYSLVKLLVDES